MRPALAFVLLLVVAGSTVAQDTNGHQHKVVRFDDGGSESFWKATSPSGASDYFSVDLGPGIDGKTVSAVYCDCLETHGLAGTISLGIAENCGPGIPDVNIIVASANSPSVQAGESGDTDDYYSVACSALGSPIHGHSVLAGWTSGDSHIWIGADSSSSVSGRSWLTTSAFAGCSGASTGLNWSLAVGLTGDAGELMINGGSVTSVTQDGGEACFTFYGPARDTPGVLFVISPLVLRLLAVTTDGPFEGPCPKSWSLCTTFTCADPTFSSFTFGHYYFDATDLKPNGKPKIKLATADLTVIGSQTCVPSFGQKDDCIEDSTMWKVQNPAGPSDWFNVNHGFTDGVGVSSVTGIEIASWDFCGFGPSWAEVGVYEANLGLDPAGCTPDLNQPIGTAGGSSAAMPPSSSGWGCPLTYYDIADGAVSTGTTYHAGCHWQPNDSCTWLGSDTDGTDSPLGAPIPNNGCCSLFTLDGYATPAVRFSAANWMMQIEWR